MIGNICVPRAIPVLDTSEFYYTIIIGIMYIYGFIIPIQRWFETRYAGNTVIQEQRELMDVIRNHVDRDYWERWHDVADGFPAIVVTATTILVPSSMMAVIKMYMIFMAIRLAMCNVTILPASSRISKNWWLSGFRSPRSFSHDLVVSGHSGIMNLCWWVAFATLQYHPQHKTTLVLLYALCLVGSILMVMTHQHYTIDIIVGTAVASLVAIFYLQC